MNGMLTVVEEHIRLSTECADQLSRLARTQRLSKDQIVEKALDILFSLTDLFDERTERKGWSFLSEDSLRRIWDNEEDTAYDNWRELYGVPGRLPSVIDMRDGNVVKGNH